MATRKTLSYAEFCVKIQKLGFRSNCISGQKKERDAFVRHLDSSTFAGLDGPRIEIFEGENGLWRIEFFKNKEDAGSGSFSEFESARELLVYLNGAWVENGKISFQELANWLTY